jgi:hypothetical protein
MSARLHLSKSLYMTGLQCHKGLWLHKYQPDLKDEAPPEQESMFDFGAVVGRYAQELFPGGILIPYGDISHSQQIALTQEAITNGDSTIYEGAFSYNDVFVKADILHQGPAGWELYEVKVPQAPRNTIRMISPYSIISFPVLDSPWPKPAWFT